MTIQELKTKIEQQKQHNKRLYDSIPLPSHADPMNKQAESILTEWRKGQKALQQLLRELQEMELQERKQQSAETRTFVNGFGEATKREITTTAYKASQRRLSKEIMSFIGNRA